MSWEVFYFLFSRKFVFNWHYFFLKYFLEFTIDAVWTSIFFIGKDLTINSNYFNRYRATQIIFRVLSLSGYLLLDILHTTSYILGLLEELLSFCMCCETTGMLGFLSVCYSLEIPGKKLRQMQALPHLFSFFWRSLLHAIYFPVSENHYFLYFIQFSRI